MVNSTLVSLSCTSGNTALDQAGVQALDQAGVQALNQALGQSLTLDQALEQSLTLDQAIRTLRPGYTDPETGLYGP